MPWIGSLEFYSCEDCGGFIEILDFYCRVGVGLSKGFSCLRCCPYKVLLKKLVFCAIYRLAALTTLLNVQRLINKFLGVL